VSPRGCARVATLAALATLATAGCGQRAADLFVVHRSGGIPGARLALLVSDDGFVSCNGAEPRQLSGDQLLTARGIERDLGDLAADRVSLPPGPGAVLTYRVRTARGSVRFSDTSRGQRPVLFRTAAFVREVARRVCGLPR
jgi:hypothetical protein